MIGKNLHDYLRPYIVKLRAKISGQQNIADSSTASAVDKNSALKKIDLYRKQVEELVDWDRKVVSPLANKRVELDLDDGVKVNYGKLGEILEPVKGLNVWVDDEIINIHK